jgi:acid phosphatase type 7
LKRFSLLLVLACGATPKVVSLDADSGADDDSGIPCPGAGVSKGPWSLAVDDTHAVVRWEACRSLSDRTIAVTPEAGGTAIQSVAVETSTVIPETYTAPLNTNAMPDYGGTWYMEEAALSNLAPGTCYSYVLGVDASRKGRFCTGRASGAPIHFLAIGDTNPALGDSTTNVLNQVLPKNPDFTLHLGDIQYYDSTVETWALWAQKMQPLLSSGAFFPSIGNHELEKPDELTNYTLRYFHGAGFGGTDEYYSFHSGGVWFFVLDTELPSDASAPQSVWLTAQLDAAMKSPGFRFSIVYFHKPFVTCGDTGDNPAARAFMEPLFVQYKVPLVLQAHMHGYERFEFPNITYVTSAGGGGKMGNVNGNISNSYCGQRVASGDFFHGLVVDVTTGKLTAQAIDDKGVVRDSFDKVVP